MRKWILFFLLLTSLAGCAEDMESPLILPMAAEPSAKMHNDEGISHYQAGRNMDALLHFIQASVADNTAGEIHFNIALAFHKQGKQKKAREHFKQALKFAGGNKKILESALLKKYLQKGNEKN